MSLADIASSTLMPLGDAELALCKRILRLLGLTEQQADAELRRLDDLTIEQALAEAAAWAEKAVAEDSTPMALRAGMLFSRVRDAYDFMGVSVSGGAQ